MDGELPPGWYLFPRRFPVGTAPAITSVNSKTIDAGGTQVITVTATGTYPIAFSISGGANATSFTLDPYSGALTFVNASVDGSYSVTVEATNSFGADTQSVSVTVSGGGPAPPYTASAVHFDDASFLRIAGLSSADSPYLTFFTFFRIEGMIAGHSQAPIIDFYPAGDEDTIAISIQGRIYFQFDNNGAGHLGGGYDWASALGLVGINDGIWHSLLISFDFDHPSGEKLCAVVLDRVPLTPLTVLDTSGEAFPFAFNGAPVGTPDTFDDFPTIAPQDQCLYQVRPGVKIVQSDGTILDADLNNFVTADNKPVDPAIATAAYGTAAILYDGDATGYAVNQGNGGVAVLTGALTNASSSPSD